MENRFSLSYICNIFLPQVHNAIKIGLFAIVFCFAFHYTTRNDNFSVEFGKLTGK